MKKLLALLLGLMLASSLAGCAGSPAAPNDTPVSPDETAAASPPNTAEKPAVRAGFLKGPTGIGAAYLMEQSEKGETRLDYTFTVESDPSIMLSGVIAGNVDIAAVPTNAAAVLFNKTGGGVKIIAVNTLSVLYILENGETVQSVADLRGRTLYAMGQAANPEYVLNYILRQNGLEPGKDVTVEFTDPAELAAKMASGEIDLAMLPVPNSTSVLMKNAGVRAALALGAAWADVTGGSVLTQGCVVVRSDLDNLDAVISGFLADYEKSVTFMTDPANIDEASQLAFRYEMVGSAEIARAAIPDCNIVFIAGADNIKTSISGYFDVMLKADPKSLGGAIPDDAFYYGD